MWVGRLTLRRAAHLAVWLPAGSAVYHAEGSDAAWSEAEHLAATQIDVLNIANWQRGGDKSKAKPKHVERPGDKNRAAQHGARHAGRAERARRRQAERRAMLEQLEKQAEEQMSS